MDAAHTAATPPRWPTQDHVDRSGSFSIIASLTAKAGSSPATTEEYPERWQLDGPLREWLEESVAEAVQEVLGDGTIPSQSAVHYQIGPACEGLPTYIVTVWDHAQSLGPIADGVIASCAADILLSIGPKLKHRFQQFGAKRHAPRLILTAYDVMALCEAHVRKHYHPRAKLRSEWYPTTTEFYGGYRSPAHPTGDMEYVVTVAAGRKVYCYAVNGSGQVHAHSLKESGRIQELPLPELLAAVAIE